MKEQKKIQHFATVRPKKRGKSTTNGQNYWKFRQFYIVKNLVKIMVFHDQKSVFSKLIFLSYEIGSLWPHRTTSFSRSKGTKLCENVICTLKNTFTKFGTRRTTETRGTVRSKRPNLIREKYEFWKDRFLIMKSHDFDQIFQILKPVKFSVFLTVGDRFSTFFRSDSGKI